MTAVDPVRRYRIVAALAECETPDSIARAEGIATHTVVDIARHYGSPDLDKLAKAAAALAVGLGMPEPAVVPAIEPAVESVEPEASEAAGPEFDVLEEHDDLEGPGDEPAVEPGEPAVEHDEVEEHGVPAADAEGDLEDGKPPALAPVPDGVPPVTDLLQQVPELVERAASAREVSDEQIATFLNALTALAGAVHRSEEAVRARARREEQRRVLVVELEELGRRRGQLVAELEALDDEDAVAQRRVDAAKSRKKRSTKGAFECGDCDRAFQSEADAIVHVRRAHGAAGTAKRAG